MADTGRLVNKLKQWLARTRRAVTAHCHTHVPLAAMVLAAGLLALPGCFGVTHNPSYVPHLFPFGDIIRTHAKPPGFAYFTNFDKHACTLKVDCVEGPTGPAGSSHVLIATILDKEGNPRRNRRVEWLLEGAGNIVEVDESGFFPGRGYKVDNKYAVSYTDYCTHKFNRGNNNPADDFEIHPGQSWCVITSATEGDTAITVYAPEIHDWDKNKIILHKHWVDAVWRFPPPAVARAGMQQVFTTDVSKHSDGEPLANYRVRYRIIDGPPAFFLPDHSTETTVVTDLSGHAHVTLAQAAPAAGVNNISIEVIRPPDPTAPSGVGIIIGQGQTRMDWQAPQLSLAVTGPQAVAVGQDTAYALTVANSGLADSQDIVLHAAIPEGLQFVRSEPPAQAEGTQLTWRFPGLSAGRSHSAQIIYRAQRPGQVVQTASVTSADGLHDEKQATTLITQPQITVSMGGAEATAVGVPISIPITLANPGTGPATNVVLLVEYDQGLEFVNTASPGQPGYVPPNITTVRMPLAAVMPGPPRTEQVTLMPRQAGQFTCRASVSADGGLTATAQHAITVRQAQVKVNINGPARSYVNKTVSWEIHASNPGDVPIANVVIRHQFPPEMALESADQGGVVAGTGEVQWQLGTLQAHEEKVLTAKTRCVSMVRRAVNIALASADPSVRDQAETAIEILGLPGIQMNVIDSTDPVEVGKRVTYTINVLNPGSLPVNQVQLTAFVPPELRIVNAAGQSQGQIQGQQVTFPPADNLLPNQRFNYTVEAEALQPGKVKFRAELKAATMTDGPLVSEEPTTIVASDSAMP